MPDLHHVEADQESQHQRARHLQELGKHEQVAAFEAVGKHTAHQREEKDRSRLQDRVQGQQEGAVAHLPDQPTLRQHLHPRADGGGAGADPHQAEIPVMKSFEDPLNHGGENGL